ncbi:uncharacterized protein LOC142242835 [Haematobia irritans]|uniref:uncharacterized protein LOC142242835 n=1 Tax=Haematobia irritans TaxID=7368 RepID=UPI003F4F4651
MPVNTFARFIRAADAVVKFGTRVSSLKEEHLDVYSLRAQVEEAKSLWEKVKERYEECLDDLQEDSDKGKVESADGKYEATYDAYIRIVSSIERKIDGLKAVHRASTPIRQADVADISARSGNVDISGNSLLLGVDHGAVHSLALPPCDIEVFDGDFQSWPTFRDLFTAVYVKNSRLSDIERLCHLLKKTSGDAREVVRRFPLTDRSFELAWRTLKETYDNLRILVSNQLKLLFDLPVLDTETSSGLKNLQRGINACISAMAVNNVPTNDWDPILIYLCVQRLPKISVTLWEQGISDKSALSSWVDMDRFLTERIQTLTCLRDLKGIDASKKTDGRKLRTHFTNAVPKSSPSRSRNSQYTSHSSRDSVDKICVLCPRQSHHLRVCPKFRNLSVNDRLTAVKRYRCCFNCLSRRHDVNNCATSRSCEKCQGRHHTLLHRDSSHSMNVATTSSTVSAARPTDSSGLIDPQPSTSSGIVSGTSARQVFHVSQNRSVLLGTAMVNIVHQGMTYPARALIDPASEASFITEKMQKLLRISITSAMSSISGVNQSVSITSRDICPLSIGSPIDGSVLVEATALVLPKISGNLPSFQVGRNYMSRLPNLRLADPNLFDSRPVDLLLGADVYPRIILQGVRSGILGSLIAQQTVFGWLITGSIPTSSVTVFSTTVEFMEEDGLDKTLLRFWELEDLPRRAICSPADKFCEENFKNTTYRDSDGRYVVTLPIKPLESLPADHLVDAKLLEFVEASSSKPLGIRWNAQLDLFYFEMKPIERKSRFTKREVLSAIARLFDPVGWLGPVIIVAKIIMQQVWLDKIGWDESLPLQTERQWRKFVETYQDVNHVRIPRWVNYSTDCEVELHVFSDASEKAYAGVVYVRVVTPQGHIFTHLLSCKTKVAPIKSISLPRLELCGAVLASELYKSIARELDIEFRRVYCWTDSTIVRSWLRKTPSTWSTFVANRVCRIQENTGGQNWYHVRSEDNPADLGSRGVSPAELAVSSLWWHGPEWLCSASSQWDISDLTPLETDVEVRAVKTHASFFTNYEDILERFSSLDRALRVIAYIFRFYHRTHYSHASRNVYHDTTLTATELKAVRLRLAVLSQRAHYPDECRFLMEKKPLGSRTSLLSLNPFLDEEGVMRLNGRLSRCPTCRIVSDIQL